MQTTYSKFWDDYELIDAGNDKKLERWGNIITIRPDRNAYFPSVLDQNEWKKQAHFEFIEKTKNTGEWMSLAPGLSTEWQINYNMLTYNLKLTKFKHLGLFPEQQTNWDFIIQNTKKNDKFLNLFGYTGAASLVANKCGADVFHCDSVKQVINWAKLNMDSSELNGTHWVLDDALKFSNREVKREKKYNGIIMSPPAFGIGVKKERWKLENKLPELLKAAKQLLTDDGYLIVNTYSPKLTAKDINVMAKRIFSNKRVEVTRLSARTSTEKRLDYGELTRVY